MTQCLKAVQLSKRQLAYLKETRFLARKLIQIVNSTEVASEGGHVVRVPRDIAEQFRTAFTEHLSRVGFDEKYKLNPEGEMLEELIDLFY